jgi:hypothetical protein
MLIRTPEGAFTVEPPRNPYSVAAQYAAERGYKMAVDKAGILISAPKGNYAIDKGR